MDFHQYQGPLKKVLTTSPQKADPEKESFMARSMRMVLQHATDMISIHTPDRKIKYVSPACYKVLGYSIEDLMGEELNDFIHPEDLPQVKFPDKKLIDTPVTYTLQFRMKNKAGDYIWVESNCATVHHDKTGELVEVVFSTRDITELKKLTDQVEGKL